MPKIIFPRYSLKNLKGVLVDIDNTLYPYLPAHQKAIYACFQLFLELFQIPIVFEDFYQLYRAKRTEVTERLQPQGACRSRLFAFQSMFEQLKLPNAFNYALKFENSYWQHFMQSMELSESAHHFLIKCRNKDIPICAVTDLQAHFQIQKLQALKVDTLIDFLVTSEEAGVEKPATQIFEIALNKLNLKASEVVMIGDDENKDCLGAKALGIKNYMVRVSTK